MTAKNQPNPLRSVFTNNFPNILSQLGVSLAVSTYQAGKVILLRAYGEQLNTHFRSFHKQLGIAGNFSRLPIARANTARDFRNMPALVAGRQPAGRHDADL